MTVKVTKPSINVREKLSELDKETGIKGEELLRADTSAEAREALQLDQQLFTDFESTGIDDNATSTAMTLDSSGNLLVGKTSSALALVGVEAQADGDLWATADSRQALSLRRNTTDGNIANFWKDGTTVGSIGIESGGFYIDGESGHTGLTFGAAQVLPRDNGAATNGLTDLGANGIAWKDLYLSGGVYLGGTGAANKLEDYEEGTWTPILGGRFGQSGQVYETQAGWFRKIGDLVVASFFCKLTTRGAISGEAIIDGLPFTSQGNPNYRGHISSVATDSIGVNVNSIVMTVVNSATNGRLGWNTTESSSQSFAGDGSTIFVNGCTVQGTITYLST